MCNIQSETNYYPFMYGGVAILSSTTGNMLAINARNDQHYFTENTTLDGQGAKIMDCLELCECGLTIPTRILLQLFGKEELGLFLKWREEHYE